MLLILLYIFLNPLANWGARKGLATLEGFVGDFEKVHVTPFPLVVEVTKLKLTEEPVSKGEPPLIYADKIRAEVSLAQALIGHVVGTMRVEGPKLSYTIRKPVETQVKETQAKLEPPIRRLLKQLESLPPSRIDRVEVVDAEVLLEDLREENKPRFWIHAMDFSMENLPSNRDMSMGQATWVAFSGTLQKSGQMSGFISADPLTLPPHFAGKFALSGLQLVDIHDVVSSKTGIAFPKGSFELFADFKSERGHLNGGVKPLLKDLDAKPVDKGLGAKLKSALADVAFDVFKSKDAGDEKIGTVIPIRGNLDQPNVQIWPTILGVLRNAFVEGLAGAFAHTPPPVSGDKQNALKQTVEALKPGNGDPPKAQPTN